MFPVILFKEKTDKRLSILEAAEKLFCELGYEATSTRQIAKEASANMAMINYYFGSKEGVFMEIMTKRVTDFGSQLNSINEEQLPCMEKLLKTQPILKSLLPLGSCKDLQAGD